MSWLSWFYLLIVIVLLYQVSKKCRKNKKLPPPQKKIEPIPVSATSYVKSDPVRPTQTSNLSSKKREKKKRILSEVPPDNLEVLAFLSRIDCFQYRQLFLNQGWKALNDLRELEVSDLVKAGVKERHAERISLALSDQDSEIFLRRRSVLKRPLQDIRSISPSASVLQRRNSILQDEKDSQFRIPSRYYLAGDLWKTSLKKKRGLWSSKQKRFFETSGPYLKYFKNEKERDQSQILAALDLRQLLQITPVNEREFQLEFKDKTYLLQAKSQDERQRWIDGLVARRAHIWGLVEPPKPVPIETKIEQKTIDDLAYIKQFPKTPEEKSFASLISRFREAVAPTLKAHPDALYCREVVMSDRACLRFLFARGSNVEKAAEMFAECIDFRIQHKSDTLLDAPYPTAAAIKGYFIHGWHKYGKQGHPLYMEWTGAVQIENVYEITDFDGMYFYHLHNTEYFKRRVLQKASNRSGKLVDQVITVLNLKGLGRKQLTKQAYQLVSMFAKTDQLLYPEILYKSFLINAPYLFSVVWKIVKPWLDKRVQNKISIIYGDDISELLQYMDADSIPREFGGTCECKGGCFDNSDHVREYLEVTKVGLNSR